jgi:hypothetical protein
MLKNGKMTKKLFIVILTVLIATANHSANSFAEEVNPYGGVAIKPPGPNEIIFTVTNGNKIVKYSTKSLKALNPTIITIYEPFVKKEQSFTVIPISTIAKKSGINSKATLKTIALNDYTYTNTLRNFVNAKGYIAIARNGKPIPYDQGGPIRIVFPKESKWAKFLDPWNWSLSSIVVK